MATWNSTASQKSSRQGSRFNIRPVSAYLILIPSEYIKQPQISDHRDRRPTQTRVANSRIKFDHIPAALYKRIENVDVNLEFIKLEKAAMISEITQSVH